MKNLKPTNMKSKIQKYQTKKIKTMSKKIIIATAVLSYALLATFTGRAQMFAFASTADLHLRLKADYKLAAKFSNSKDVVNSRMSKIKLCSAINSGAHEMGPLISQDGKTIFFSRYSEPVAGAPHQDEEIWFAKWDEQKENWSAAENIGQPLNNAYPNYVNSVSDNGQTLLLGNTYFKNGKMKEGLSLSHFENGKWSFPENFEFEAGSKCLNWAGCFLSNSGNILILSCEQKNNSAGSNDLYVSKKIGGNKWSTPQNIGSAINSKGSEVAPFLSEDEMTIFFTSNGHEGFGGTDIFMATRLDESWTNWSAPENMGNKINTEGNESFFSLSPAAHKVYFTMEVNGHSDIYTMEMTEPEYTAPISPVQLGEATAIDFKLEEKNTSVLAIAALHFRSSSFTIDAAEIAALEKIVAEMKADVTVNMEVKGFADNSGVKNTNEKLARQRALAAAQFLMSKGISRDRIIIKGEGCNSPVGDNTTVEGRAMNRRVEFKFLKK
jgi:outer membrane protein OmpA-like peptidoglycan-associated protein